MPLNSESFPGKGMHGTGHSCASVRVCVNGTRRRGGMEMRRHSAMNSIRLNHLHYEKAQIWWARRGEAGLVPSALPTCWRSAEGGTSLRASVTSRKRTKWTSCMRHTLYSTQRISTTLSSQIWCTQCLLQCDLLSCTLLNLLLCTSLCPCSALHLSPSDPPLYFNLC